MFPTLHYGVLATENLEVSSKKVLNKEVQCCLKGLEPAATVSPMGPCLFLASVNFNITELLK